MITTQLVSLFRSGWLVTHLLFYCILLVVIFFSIRFVVKRDNWLMRISFSFFTLVIICLSFNYNPIYRDDFIVGGNSDLELFTDDFESTFLDSLKVSYPNYSGLVMLAI
jgi:hypothetical protein